MPSFSVYLSLCRVASSCIAGGSIAAPGRSDPSTAAKLLPDLGEAAKRRRLTQRIDRRAAAVNLLWLAAALMTLQRAVDSGKDARSRLAKRFA